MCCGTTAPLRTDRGLKLNGQGQGVLDRSYLRLLPNHFHQIVLILGLDTYCLAREMFAEPAMMRDSSSEETRDGLSVIASNSYRGLAGCGRLQRRVAGGVGTSGAGGESTV